MDLRFQARGDVYHLFQKLRYQRPVHITEQMLAPVRRRFGDVDGALPVQELKHLYNEAVHGVLPIFDSRLPDDHWKQFVRQHGMRPTGVEIFTPTDDWKADWGSEDWTDSFALVLAFVERVPRLSTGHEWQALSHRCEGVQASWVDLIALELTPKPENFAMLQRIAGRWRQSNLCDPSRVVSGYRLEAEARISEYRAQLAELGVEWTGGSIFPREAIYPVDATQAALEALAVDPPALWAISDPAGSGKPVSPVVLLLSAN